MIFEIPVSKRREFSFLFSGQTDTLILSCLQGFHGSLFTDHPNKPCCGRILCGDFCFLGGDPSAPAAKELLLNLNCPAGQEHLFFLPPTKEWEKLLLTVYKDQIKHTSRYGLKKEGMIFNKQSLEKILSTLPNEYSIKQIDQSLYEKIYAEEWSRDFVSNFSPESFALLGLGFIILKDKQIVAGASSYTRYSNGIEIEIATREDQRRKGLASVCGAALILACMKQQLYPSWDAANQISLHLAQKLGYHFSEEYPAYLLSF